MSLFFQMDGYIFRQALFIILTQPMKESLAALSRARAQLAESSICELEMMELLYTSEGYRWIPDRLIGLNAVKFR